MVSDIAQQPPGLSHQLKDPTSFPVQVEDSRNALIWHSMVHLKNISVSNNFACIIQSILYVTIGPYILMFTF